MKPSLHNSTKQSKLLESISFCNELEVEEKEKTYISFSCPFQEEFIQGGPGGGGARPLEIFENFCKQKKKEERKKKKCMMKVIAND